MSNFKKGLDKFVHYFDHALCFFGVIFYLTFVACVLIQVVSRNFLMPWSQSSPSSTRYWICSSR